MNDLTNIEGLKELYHSNATARAFLNHCVGRSNNQTVTKVDRALANLQHAGHETPRANLIEVFHALANLNCGQYFPGCQGRPARFVWRVNMVDTARAAAGRPRRVKAIPEDLTPDETMNDILTQSFHRRPELGDAFELPAHLTESEAETLAGFTRTWPMDTD